MTFFYRLYAEFQSCCEKYKEATLNIIMAMYHLHKALKESNSESLHPELGHFRFEQLSNDIGGYYSELCEDRYVSIKLKSQSLLALKPPT